MFYGLLNGFGLFFLLLTAFYLIGMPILLFRLQARVKTLEAQNQGSVAEPAKKKILKPIVPLEPMPEEVFAHAAAKIPKLKAEVKTKAPPAGGKSFEEQVGGHLFQWIGIGALIIALIFFLKWSFDNGLIGPTGRIVLGYLLAGGAIVAGDRMRAKYGTWSLAFTGGGALASYIVTWIASHTYMLFPTSFAFVIYILTTVLVCVLAGYYNALPLATFGIIGGFITPMLLGQSGSTVSLLLYILLLDVGILVLGHKRQWRILNAVGLIGTMIYEIYALNDRTMNHTTALLFALGFLAIYMLVPLLYNVLQQKKSESADISILVINALLHFWLIMLWMGKTTGLWEEFGAMVSLGFAAVFLVFSTQVYRRNKTDTPLVLASLSLTILFASIAIPMEFGGFWVPLAWSIEGSFLLWMALKLHDNRLQKFAWIVMIAAYYWYLFVPDTSNGGIMPGIIGIMHTGPVVFLSSGLYLFIFWALLFFLIALFGMDRDDRKEQYLSEFIMLGLGVLTVSLFMNGFSGSTSTLTGLQRFFEAAALIAGSYGVLYEASRSWQKLSDQEKSLYTFLSVAVQVITLVYLTNEFARAVDEKRIFTSFTKPQQILQVGISIMWAVYASVALILGLAKNWQPIRVFSLVLLMIALAKLAIVDFFYLGTGARVIGFTILGGLLVGASMLYQQKKDTIKSLFTSSK